MEPGHTRTPAAIGTTRPLNLERFATPRTQRLCRNGLVPAVHIRQLFIQGQEVIKNADKEQAAGEEVDDPG